MNGAAILQKTEDKLNVGNEEHIGVFACATTLNVPGKSEKFEAARCR